MSIFQIALLQMTPHGNDQAANLQKGTEFCRQARALGADLALFPEMWNIGYTSFVPPDTRHGDLWRAPRFWGPEAEPAPDLDEARARWQAQAVSVESPFVAHFAALAQELDLAIALTYLQRWPGAPRNAVSLIDRHGDLLFTYAKVHTCDFDYLESACTPGDDFYVAELDTASGPVQVGAMICFDREFPEAARLLMLKGAEVIVIPNACTLELNRLSQLRTRAYENMTAVALANYAAPNDNGHSVAFDPIAFDRQGRSRDTLIVEAGEQEGILLAPFDLDALRDYREREVWGDAFRRPHRYGLLTASDVREPFRRVDQAGRLYPRAER